MNERFGLKGQVKIQEIRDGKVLSEEVINNLVVNGGLEAVIDLLDGDSVDTFDYMGIGEGATAVDPTDSALGDEKARSAQLTPTQTAVAGIYKSLVWEATFTKTAGSDAITEMGMFDTAVTGGTMFNRVVFTAKDNENNDLKITYTLTAGSS